MTKYSLMVVLVFEVSMLYGQPGTWTWQSGDSIPNQAAIRGVLGVPTGSSNPGARYESAEWLDNNGEFWLFGGTMIGGGTMSDLWKYDPIADIWTWVHGYDLPYGQGWNGIKGISDVDNIPGSRGYGCITWTGTNNNLWLFGGWGYDMGGNGGQFCDMWEYNMGNNEWTWWHGSEWSSMPGGFYGQKGIADSTNCPRPRAESAVSWTDADGNFWLFGGEAYDYVNNYHLMNDLWQFDVFKKEWTWISGDSIEVGGNYGPQGQLSPTNAPGGRLVYSHWQDSEGNFWIFGGLGRDKNNVRGPMNDLWMFDMNQRMWKWVGGSDTINNPGVYPPSKCSATAFAWPPARFESRACWQDTCGFFWMFGGRNSFNNNIEYNDLWKYNPTTNKWTWVSGDSLTNRREIYGLKGIGDPLNSPGSRAGSMSWNGPDGTLWMYGGVSQDTATSAPYFFNDIWKYDPDFLCGDLLQINAGVDSSLCIGDSIILNANGAMNYLWLPSYGLNDSLSDQPSASPLISTTYQLSVPGSVCHDKDSVTLEVINLPSLVMEDAFICDGDSMIIGDLITNYSYFWSTGDTTSSIIAFDEGQYILQIRDSNNCLNADTMVLTYYPPSITDLGEDIIIKQGESTYLGPVSGDSLIWIPSTFLDDSTSFSPNVTPDMTTTYVVVVMENGCRTYDTITVIIEPADMVIYIPNSFTPNGDGINDFFEISGIGIERFELMIFDRWGQLLFNSTSVDKTWSGALNKSTSNQSLVQEDTYVYQLNVVDKIGKNAKYLGQVNVLR